MEERRGARKRNGATEVHTQPWEKPGIDQTQRGWEEAQRGTIAIRKGKRQVNAWQSIDQRVAIGKVGTGWEDAEKTRSGGLAEVLPSEGWRQEGWRTAHWTFDMAWVWEAIENERW
jgi:hypothetical protein